MAKNLSRDRILFDTGCGGTLINHKLVKKYLRLIVEKQSGKPKLVLSKSPLKLNANLHFLNSLKTEKYSGTCM